MRGREGGDGTRDGFSSFTAALDFFNARLGAWEPIVEPFNAFIKYTRAAQIGFAAKEQERRAGGGLASPMSLAGVMGDVGGVVPGGAKLSFTAASPLQIAASASCVDTVMEQWARERARMLSSSSSSSYSSSSPSAAGNSAAVNDENAELVVTFVNTLARPVYLRLPSSSSTSFTSSTTNPSSVPNAGQMVIRISPDESTEIRQPRVNRDVTLPTSIPPPAATQTRAHSAGWSLAVTIHSARGISPGVDAVGGSEAMATLDVSFPGGVHPVELRSRARRLLAHRQTKTKTITTTTTTPMTRNCEWNERFLVSPPVGAGAEGLAPTRGFLSEVVVTAAVTDLHAAAGNGAELASTALALDELFVPSSGGEGDKDDDEFNRGSVHVGDEDEVPLGAVFHGTINLTPTDAKKNDDGGDGGVLLDDDEAKISAGELKLDITVEVVASSDVDKIGTSTTTAGAREDANVSSSAAGIGGTTMSSVAATQAGAVAIGFTPEGPWLPLTSLEGSAGASAGVSHVRVGGVIAALDESLSSSGYRRCTLRSLATFCNNTAVPLQICLAPAGRSPAGGSGSSGGGGSGGSSDPGGVLAVSYTHLTLPTILLV